MRKPDARISSSFKTGYEPIIALKNIDEESKSSMNTERQQQEVENKLDQALAPLIVMKDTDNERTSKWASLSKKTTKTASPYAKLADVSGYGVKPYEGEDVIESLKQKVEEQDKVDLIH